MEIPAAGMNALTDLADQAVVLPVAAAVLLALLLTGWRRGALAWTGAIAAVLVAILCLKLLILACGDAIRPVGLVSPSGHTAAAAVVYGGLLGLLASRARGGLTLAAISGAAFALLVGATRLALHLHTVSDVVLGGLIGTAGAVAMRHVAGPRPRILPSPRVALLVCAVIVLFHGHRIPAEPNIRWLSERLWPLTLCAGPGSTSPAP